VVFYLDKNGQIFLNSSRVVPFLNGCQDLLGGVIKEGAWGTKRVSAAVGSSLSVACNLLILAAVMHSIGGMALAIFPQTLIKVSTSSFRFKFQSERETDQIA
jgi:hypothetical protein